MIANPIMIEINTVEYSTLVNLMDNFHDDNVDNASSVKKTVVERYMQTTAIGSNVIEFSKTELRTLISCIELELSDFLVMSPENKGFENNLRNLLDKFSAHI